MGKVLTAEYDATERSLKLEEPLADVQDREKVQVIVAKTIDPQRPWLALSGSMSAEQADDLERAIKEMFPPWND